MIERTLERLYQLGLTAMVEAVEEQRNRGQVDNLSFEERLCLIVDRQWEARQQKRTDRRLKQAKLKQGANSGDIDFRHKRGLDKAVILDLLQLHVPEHIGFLAGTRTLGQPRDFPVLSNGRLQPSPSF